MFKGITRETIAFIDGIKNLLKVSGREADLLTFGLLKVVTSHISKHRCKLTMQGTLTSEILRVFYCVDHLSRLLSMT